MKKHRYCEDKCQILEHKGYHTCAQTGRCEYLDTPAQLPNCPIHGSSWCSCPHIDEPTVDSVKRVASKLSAQPLEHTKDCAVHEPVLRPCSCGLETRLRANAQYLTAQLALQRQAKIDSQTLVEKLEQQLALTIATLVEEKRNHQTTIDDLLEVGVDLADGAAGDVLEDVPRAEQEERGEREGGAHGQAAAGSWTGAGRGR